MNWKNTVSKLNAKHYAFPAGWDTRDVIAEQLECSIDRVDVLLSPGLKSGEIEKQQFPVWDDRLSRKVMVMGYRQRPAGEIAPSSHEAADDVMAAVKQVHARHPAKSPSDLRKLLPKSMRSEVSAADIRRILGL